MAQGLEPADVVVEFRLLRRLVSHPNRPQSRDTLIEAVWGYSGEIGSARWFFRPPRISFVPSPVRKTTSPSRTT